MEEKELIEQLCKGDTLAYKCLYDRYYSMLCAYAYRFVADHDDAESVVQDVIHYVWQNRERLSITGNLQYYLIRAVKNRSLNHLKKQGAMRDLREKIITEHSFVMEEDAVQKLLVKELQLLLNEALDQLPALTAEVFRKSRSEQLTYTEIAEELGVSTDVVKYHMKSALAKLRVSLKGYLLLGVFLIFF